MAPDALAGCAGAAVYCPAGTEDAWNVGIPAAGNRLAPYGAELPDDPLRLEVGQTAGLFDGGGLQAPDPVEASYSYAAKPLSVGADGTATGKAPGASEVSVSLALDGIELARASRTVEVMPAPEPEPESSDDTEQDAAPTAEANALEPRLMASGIEVLSGAVPLQAGDMFDYEYKGSNLRYQVNGNPQGTCTVLGRSYSVSNLEGDLVIPEKAVDTATGAEYTVTKVASWGFEYTLIDSVTFPQTLVSLGQGAFRGCSNLRSAVVPKSVSVMGFNPFISCTALSDPQVEEGSQYFSSQDGVLYNKSKTVLYGGTPASLVGHFDIPETVATVKVNSFSGCNGMTGLSIPKSVSNFGEGHNIISTLQGLKNLTIDPENQYYFVEDGLLYEKKGGVPVALIGGTPASSPAFPSIPDTVTRLGKSAFSAKTNLSSIEIPPSVTYYGASLFLKCTSLSNVVSLGGGSVTFDSAPFGDCTGLKELIIASSDPVLTNTEGTQGHNQFVGVDTPNVTVHCPESAQNLWADFGLNVVPFSMGVPSVVGLPGGNANHTSEFVPSIPSDSAFAGKVKLVHALEAGSSGITADLSDPTGRSIVFRYGQGNGSAALTSKLVYASDRYGDIVLAESSSTVSVASQSGALPTATDSGNTDQSKASWSLSPDGVLSVRGTEKVGDFGWTYGDAAAKAEHWGPLRDSVKKVDIRSLAGGASSMACWFSDMPQLSDVSDLVIPEGIEDVSSLLRNCAVSSLPQDFKLPGSVRNADDLLASNPLKELPDSFAASFAGSANLSSCRSMLERTGIERLPDGFALPSSVSDISSLFAESKLEELPNGFTIPGTASVADSLFRNCTSLLRLPSGFTLGEGVTSAVQMFENCISLVSLSEGFKVPSSLSGPASVAKMFGNCPKLQVLPAEFSLPEGFDLAEAPDLFYCYQTARLGYAGSDAALLGASEQYWTSQKRIFEYAQASSVVFKLQDAESGAVSTWTSSTPDKANGTIINPEVPHREGKVFTLWYADEAHTKRFDFTKRVSDQLSVGADGKYVLYGAYIDEVAEGALPVTGNAGWASWSLGADGTLYIRGTGTINLEIPDSGTDDPAYAWSPYRASVKKVSMQPALKSSSMKNWFCEMKALEDFSEAFVPDRVKNMHKAFLGCSSLKSLPEGFSIPSTVENLASAFGSCKSLVALPSSFILRDGALTNVTGIFKRCSSLASLPEGFTVPESVTYLDSAFCDCPSLTSLPDGFALPSGAVDSTETFFVDVPAGNPRVKTFYAGDDANLLAYDWEADGRTLVVDEGDMGEWGMQRATFMVQSAVPDDAGDFPWEMRSVAWSDKEGMLANPGDPVLDGYAFTGWCMDEGCLEPFDFSKPLPAGGATLYGKWIKHGGRGTLEGALPTVDGRGSAWWSITSDGMLNVKCEDGGSIDTLGFKHDYITPGYWDPFRDEVTRINMHADVKAWDMTLWFGKMQNLKDVSAGFFIPSNCTELTYLFFTSRALEKLPDRINIPEGALSMGGMFEQCSSLKNLPDDFTVPSEVKTAFWLVGATAIETLPTAFSLPENLVAAECMFKDCASLKHLPSDLVIPPNALVREMFANCPKLTTLPANLLSRVSTPAALEDLNAGMGMFGVSAGGPVTTYFPAPATNADLVRWADQNRVLATSVPEGKCLVSLVLPGSDEAWATMLADADSLLVEPDAPARDGQAFEGWYADAACTILFDFSEPLTGNVTLYAQYADLSGTLPTVGGGRNASWEVSADGVLSIRCDAPDAVIETLWADNGSSEENIAPKEGYWSAWRTRVTKVVMGSDVKAVDMRYWFSGMTELTDVSEVFVPEGVKDVSHLFHWCKSMKELPADFRLPESVTVARHLFSSAYTLESLPAGFALPKDLTDATALLLDANKLRTLPAGFTLPEQVTEASFMFWQCYELQALPDTFKLSPVLENAFAMFNKCTSLTGLPAGFSLPKSLKNAGRMLSYCSSLTSLPDGFRFEDPQSVESVDRMLCGNNALTGLPASFELAGLSDAAMATVGEMFMIWDNWFIANPLPTYYAGDDPARVTPYEGFWEKQRRVLYAAGGADPLPAGSFKVSFNLQEPGGENVSRWTTALALPDTQRTARLARPADPSRYGYAFDGWYADPSFASASKVAFDADGTVAVDRDLALYGRYVLCMSYDIPLTAKVAVDASGEAAPAPLSFRSLTPTPLLLRSVAVAEAPGAARLFPDGDGRRGVNIVVGVGGGSFSIPLGGSQGYLGEIPAAGPAAAAEVPGTLSIERNGAQIDFQPGEDITSLAMLTWTVEAV